MRRPPQAAPHAAARRGPEASLGLSPAPARLRRAHRRRWRPSWAPGGLRGRLCTSASRLSTCRSTTTGAASSLSAGPRSSSPQALDAGRPSTRRSGPARAALASQLPSSLPGPAQPAHRCAGGAAAGRGGGAAALLRPVPRPAGGDGLLRGLRPGPFGHSLPRAEAAAASQALCFAATAAHAAPATRCS